MDVKEQITKAVEKITKDPKLQEQFQKDPVKALESVLGVDLPDDVIEQVVKGVKANLTGDKISDSVDALKGLFKNALGLICDAEKLSQHGEGHLGVAGIARALIALGLSAAGAVYALADHGGAFCPVDTGQVGEVHGLYLDM